MGDHSLDMTLDRLAEDEGMPLPEVVREAIAFYASLPQAARRSLRVLSALGQSEAAGAAAERVIVQIGFDAARQHGNDTVAWAYGTVPFASEASEIDKAIRLSNEARREAV